MKYRTFTAGALLWLLLGTGLACAPAVKIGSICDAPKLLGWARSDFDAFFGQPTGVSVARSGRADVSYSYRDSTYDVTFGDTSAQAKMTSILIATTQSFDDPDDLLAAMGMRARRTGTAAPMRQAYDPSEVGLSGSSCELSAMRTAMDGPWNSVYIRTMPFAAE